MSDTRTAEAGFLLAETLATLTISALVLVGLVGLGPLMLRTADRSVAAMDATDDLGRTLLSLDRLVRSADRARLDGTAAHAFLLNGDAHHLTLAHHAEGADVLPVTQAVSLRSDADGRLYLAEAPLPQDLAAVSDLRFGPPRMIYAGPLRLRLAYVDGAASGPSGRPAAPLWRVGDRMPSAVTIEAVDVATGRTLAAVTSVIAADADIGCVDGTLCEHDGGPERSRAGPPASGAAP